MPAWFHNLRREVTGQAHQLAERGLLLSGVPRPQALLVLGHMRSGSTLLLHLLMTHPQIAAVGERNAVYRRRADLATLALVSRRARGPARRPLRYVADQVNHNHLTPQLALLRDARVRVLFLLRRPEPTLASLLEMSRRFYDDSWTLERAADYYVTRLKFLQAAAAALGGAPSAATLTYEGLTTQPHAALARLGSFLGLDSPLSARYATHGFTGQRGDPGPRIGAGEVLPPAPPGRPLPRDARPVAQALAAYEACRKTLAARALVGGPDA